MSSNLEGEFQKDDLSILHYFPYKYIPTGFCKSGILPKKARPRPRLEDGALRH